MKVPIVACAASVAMMSSPSAEAPGPEQGLAGATLRIEIRWLHRRPDAEERSLFERAARAWSCRLRAYPVLDRGLVGPLTLTQAGYYRREGRRVPLTRYVEIGADVRVDDVEGLLILVDDESWLPVSTGQPHGWEVDSVTGAFRPWLGVVRLSHRARGDLRTIVHEIGHLLGIGTAPGYHVRVREVPGGPVFVGPHAVAAHGAPVPLEYEHTAPCPSPMSYRDCAGEAPAPIDLAMLRDLGYAVLDPASARACLDAG